MYWVFLFFYGYFEKKIDLQMMTSWILKGAGRMKQRDIVKTWTL